MITDESIRSEIIEIARSLVGIKWAHMGRWTMNGHTGIDCVGVPLFIASSLGLKVVDHKGWYSPHPDGRTLIKLIKENEVTEIPIDQAGPGSMIIFHMPGIAASTEKRPMHCGIMVGDSPRYIVHANNEPSVKAVCENRVTDELWACVTHVFDFNEEAIF